MGKLVNKKNTGPRPSYTAVLSRIEKDGVCPFCKENFLRYHTKPILREGKRWLLSENFAPYRGTKVHLLFVHKRHLESAAQLTSADWAELGALTRWALKKFSLKGAALFMRSGDTAVTGGTVTHLHAQLLSGGARRNGAEEIRPVLGFGKKKSSRA